MRVCIDEARDHHRIWAVDHSFRLDMGAVLFSAHPADLIAFYRKRSLPLWVCLPARDWDCVARMDQCVDVHGAKVFKIPATIARADLRQVARMLS